MVAGVEVSYPVVLEITNQNKGINLIEFSFMVRPAFKEKLSIDNNFAPATKEQAFCIW